MDLSTRFRIVSGSIIIVSLAAGCGSADTGNDDLALNSAAATGEQGLRGAPEHVHLQKGEAAPSKGGASPLMTWHGGSVLTSTNTYAIFWGSEWSSASFAGDKIGGMDSFFQGFGGSRFAGTTTEYTGSNGQVTTASTYKGHTLDLSAAPSRSIRVSAAVAEVCKITGNQPDPSGVYFLFTSTGAGHVNFCAWHSWGNCSNGAPLQVAYMPNIDGIAGCDPQDTFGTGHSQGLAALANVTSHELCEAITDPRGDGWFDSSGQENGDKCAWSFVAPVALSNGSNWKLQMEWSNAVYPNGLPNRSGQKGCLQGN
jgi:hypothetical protein